MPTAPADTIDEDPGNWDSELKALCHRWKRLVAEVRARRGSPQELRAEIHSIEGQLCHTYPITLSGCQLVLEIVYEILAAREIDRVSWLVDSPAAKLASNVRHALDYVHDDRTLKRGPSP